VYFDVEGRFRAGACDVGRGWGGVESVIAVVEKLQVGGDGIRVEVREVDGWWLLRQGQVRLVIAR